MALIQSPSHLTPCKMEAIDLLLQMAYWSGAGCWQHAAARSCGFLPSIPKFSSAETCPCGTWVMWARRKRESMPLPASRYGNVYDQLPTIPLQLPLGESPASGFLVVNGNTSWTCEEWIAKYYLHDPNRKDSVGGKLLEISNVAKDLRSTAESKLDVLLAVWFGKKGSSGLSGLQRPHLIEQERS